MGVDEGLKAITSISLDHTPGYTGPPKKLGINEQFLIEFIENEGADRESLQKAYQEFKGQSYRRQNFSRDLKALIDKKLISDDNGLIRKCL